MKYGINYGFGMASFETPFCDEVENRFYTLANQCFGIRKSITNFEITAEYENYTTKPTDYIEKLEFSGDVYIWREDGAMKMLEPWPDDDWNTDTCEDCCHKSFRYLLKKEKSPVEIWAENEIRIACDKERNGAPEGEWDYGVACYESALKAFKSLLEDGHSGMSMSLTTSILNALIKGQPLTPIEDTYDIWDDGRRYPYMKDYTTYQCKRMSSLFKDVYDDGTIKYNDVNRFVCYDKNNPGSSWHNGFVDRIAGEYFPITMPYIPKTYKVICEEHLTDRKNGDFDTIAILYVRDDNGLQHEINRYFKESGSDWEEIDEIEWMTRRKMHETRVCNEIITQKVVGIE